MNFYQWFWHQSLLYLGFLLIIEHRVLGTRWWGRNQCSVCRNHGIKHDNPWKQEGNPCGSAHTLTLGRAHRYSQAAVKRTSAPDIAMLLQWTIHLNPWALEPGCPPNLITWDKVLLLKGKNNFQPLSAFSLSIYSAARDNCDLQSVCPNRTGWFPELSWNLFFLWSYWVFFIVPTQEICVSWTKGTAAKPCS